MPKYILGGDPPQSRSEQILMGQDSGPAQSRLEELLKNGAGGSVTPEQISAAVEAYLEEHPIQVEPFEIPVTQSGSTYTTTASAADILANVGNCVLKQGNGALNQTAYTVQGSNAQIVFSGTDSINGFIQNVTLTVTVNNGAVTVSYYRAEDALPTVTASDNGKFLRVVNGAWAAQAVPFQTPRVAMTSTDTTPTIEPNKLYVFPEMASLAITLAAITDNIIVNEFHFIFESGATATTLTLPASVNQPDGFTVEANMIYEVSILENCMTAQGWAVSSS